MYAKASQSKLQDHRDPLIVLRHRDSILLVLAVTTSIESCRIFLSSSDEEWGMTFILPFTIAYFTFAVPLQMCQLFLGQYGHKSLIKLWEIAPLFYGWSFHFGMLSEFIRQSEMSHHMVNAVVYGTMSFFLVIFISVLICILSELMLQTFRTFLGYRRYMQATICTLCFIASNSLISQKDNKYMKMCSYGHRYLGILMPAIFCIAVFWIYGIRRILDDFHFAMGSKLPKYWQICWKVTALLVPVCFIFFFIYTFNFKSRTDRYFLLFMISPVIISMIVRIIMTAVKLKLTYLWHSSRTFGPETKQEKIDRRNFIPHLWKRHREKAITCKHKCLVNNPLFKDAVQINEKNRKVFSLSFSSEIEAAFEGSSVDY